MHYAIEVVNLGDYADPRPVVKLAQAAEAAGWEGLFIWDHLGFVWGAPSGDPWVILAAVAQATTRLRLGATVTPLPRRRPQVLANTLATLDVLSEGRMIFAAGLGGVPEEFMAFGEDADPGVRAQKLDEGLDVLNRLWAGEVVIHQGAHYTVNGVHLAPRPVQRPRLPVWIGGDSPPALRRAAHWDGWTTGGADQAGKLVKTPQQVADAVAYIHRHRVRDAHFDVAMTGVSTPADGPLTREYAEAGVTWWLESLHGFRGPFETLLARVEAGPPRG